MRILLIAGILIAAGVVALSAPSGRPPRRSPYATREGMIFARLMASD